MRNKQMQNGTIKLIIFLFLIFIMGTIVVNNCIRYTNYYTVSQIDERVYANTINNWKANGTEGLRYSYHETGENKPISFLAIQMILNANPFYTRVLNLILIGIVTILIYKQSDNPISFIYPTIPAFLNSLWLTVEIIEMFFILLSLQYIKYSGLLTGIASVFRPYAMVYALLLTKKRMVVFVLVILTFVGLLAYNGILFDYTMRIFQYGTPSLNIKDKTSLYLLFPMLFLAVGGNKTISKYILLACIPLLFRTFGHYFIPAYTFIFLSYMQQLDTKNYIIKLKQYLYKGNNHGF